MIKAYSFLLLVFSILCLRISCFSQVFEIDKTDTSILRKDKHHFDNVLKMYSLLKTKNYILNNQVNFKNEIYSCFPPIQTESKISELAGFIEKCIVYEKGVVRIGMIPLKIRFYLKEKAK